MNKCYQQTTAANNRIRIAIQKSGRLNEESLNLLQNCGIKIKPYRDQLFCHSSNFALDLLLVRDDDIPSLVLEGICDFGIVGTNLLREQELQRNNNRNTYSNKLENSNANSVTGFFDQFVNIVRYLDFGICRLSIATPIDFSYLNITSLNGCKIATSYPYLLGSFLQHNNIDAVTTTLSGSIEIAPRMGIADCICDLVATGATLEVNYLKEVQVIFESQAVLIKSPKEFSPEKQQIIDIFQNRITGSQHANGSKYIMLHAKKNKISTIINLLPGSESPTIMSLQGDQEKVAIHALCKENIFWETMEQLKNAGASSILVLPIEKMLF